MWNFRAVSAGFILIFGVAILTTGCWEPRKKTKAQVDVETNGYPDSPLAKAADFRTNGMLWGEALPTKDLSPDWKVPNSRHYSFRVCLESRITNKQIVGQKFIVHLDDNGIEVTTDSDSCIKWQEIIPFNYFAKEPKYIVLNRRIEGIGIFKGEFIQKIGVNPWASLRNASVPEIIDLNKSSIPIDYTIDGPPEMRREALMGLNQEKIALGMTGVKVHVLQKRFQYTYEGKDVDRDSRTVLEGVPIEINMQMRPIVKVQDLTGESNPVDLKDGLFKVFAFVVADDLKDGGYFLLTPAIPPTVAEVNDSDGTITAKIQTYVSHRAVRGNLKLIMRVVPINGPPNMASYDGLYILGEYDELIGGKSPFRELEANADGSGFNFDKYLANARDSEKFIKSLDILVQKKYLFEPMDIKFETIQPGETATVRSVDFSVTTCVRNGATGKKEEKKRFLVKHIPDEKYKYFRTLGEFFKFDKSGQPIRLYSENERRANRQADEATLERGEYVITDQEGCLSVNPTVTHKYYMPEELLFPKIKIIDPESNQSTTLTMAINPWDLWATFGRDRRRLTDKYIDSIKTRVKIPSRFFIKDFSYQTLRFRYEIDEFMNLEVKKNILFFINPNVLRYNSITGGRRTVEFLRDGIYVMRVALHKKYLDPSSKGVLIEADNDPQDEESTHRFGAFVYKNAEEDKSYDKKEFVTVVEKLVRVQNGQIITPLEFSMRDLRLMRIRMTMMVELETVDERLLLISNSLSTSLKKQIREMLTDSVSDRSGIRLDKDNHELPAVERTAQYREQMKKVYGLIEELKKYQVNNQTVLTSEELDQLRYKDGLESAFAQLLDHPRHIENLVRQHEFEDEAFSETLIALRNNDFTQNPIAPVVDLDVLLDKKSGLDRRTFIGPITFLLNSNGSLLRPTDTLDEGDCKDADDCDWIKQQIFNGLSEQEYFSKSDPVYRDSPYYGSQKFMKDASIKDLMIPMLWKQRENYVNLNRKSRLLYNMMNAQNLNFVSLTDEKLKKFDHDKCKSIYSNSDCAKITDERTIPIDHVLTNINKIPSFVQGIPGAKFNYNVTREILEKLIDQPFLDYNLVHKLCRNYFDLVEYGKDFKLSLMDDRSKGTLGVKEHFFHFCRMSFDPEAGSFPFFIQQQYRIKKTRRYRYIGGKAMNINVGSNWAEGFAESFAFSRGFGADPVATALSFIPVGGKSLSGLKVGSNWGINFSETRNRQDGVSVQNGTYLVMQKAKMAIEVTDYEKCITIRPNMITPGYQTLAKHAMEWKERHDPLALAEAFAKLSQGIFLCKGESEPDPIWLPENYFYMTQHFTEGDLTDNAMILNHPWLLAIRGRNEFENFFNLIKNFESIQEEPPSWSNLGGLLTEDKKTLPEFYKIMSSGKSSLTNLSSVVNDAFFPIGSLVRVYLNTKPAFPGIYTVMPEGPDFPPLTEEDVNPADGVTNQSQGN